MPKHFKDRTYTTIKYILQLNYRKILNITWEVKI